MAETEVRSHRCSVLAAKWCFFVGAILVLGGCVTPPSAPSASTNSAVFDFEKDTFDYPNELVLEYSYAADGQWTTRARKPKPHYALHCFVLTRSALQFFRFARFDPAQPEADEAGYAKLIRRVVAMDPRGRIAEEERIVIPGYASLRAFSREHEKTLKRNCGGMLQSYFQRGNWRMVLPFTRAQQQRAAECLLAEARRSQPVVVHLARFPKLTINHAVLVIGVQEKPDSILFTAYDPNQPARPIILAYDRVKRSFSLSPNVYFPGGKLDAYPIYYGRWY